MSDHLDRAAEVLGGLDERLALLDEAGLLASPEHDAAVAAKALREAADDMDDTDDPDAIYVYNGDIDKWLRARADRIEREAGESDE